MTDSNLLEHVAEYLSFRRGLGFDLGSAACHLRSFARYAEQAGHRGPITVELATQWALRSRSREPAQAVRRLAFVRVFARHRALIDPATEIPNRVSECATLAPKCYRSRGLPAYHHADASRVP